MFELNRLYNLDCMEGMREIPDKFFQLAVVDVPYGINAGDYKRGGTQHGRAKAKSAEYTRKEWDKTAPPPEYFKELFRVSKNQIIWGANHFISRIPVDSSCWIVWDKENGNNGYADCELAWTSFKSAVRIFRFRWMGMLQGNMKHKEIRIHPTQKPVRLYEWILQNYAKPGDRILDTHAGSASALIACHRMGFEFLGFEIDKEYFSASEKRLQEEMDQLTMFAGGGVLKFRYFVRRFNSEIGRSHV